MLDYDGLTIGLTITLDALKDGNLAAIDKTYDLKYRSDLTASEADKNTGDDDTSIVYEVVETFEQTSLLATENSIDSTSGATICIDYAHHEIHEGNHFKAGYQDTTMDTGDSINLLFVTPDNTKWAHWVMTTQSTGAVTVEIFEATVVSANGTAVTRVNRDRNSSNTSEVTVFHTPTITSDGTKLSTKWVGGTGFRTDIGGSARGDSEFILKQNTNYLVRLTANADAIKGAIGGDWYEHTNKA